MIYRKWEITTILAVFVQKRICRVRPNYFEEFYKITVKISEFCSVLNPVLFMFISFCLRQTHASTWVLMQDSLIARFRSLIKLGPTKEI